MAFAAGALSQISVGPNSAVLLSAAATGGTGPYTYQWYRSTTTGFTPGVGNIITGATSLNLSDSGLIPNTTYYYKVVATDTGNSNVTATSAQLAVVTAAAGLSQNQFTQSPLLGQIDLRFPYNTISVQIDSTQATPLFAGSPVKMVDSDGGVPKVVGCTANTDECLGYINYNIKSRTFVAGDGCEISMAGNVIYLYATGAVARGHQVCNDIANNGVRDIDNATSGDKVTGWALDQAAGQGSLFRVFVKTPSFTVKA